VKSILGPSGAWWLHDRVVGRVEVRTGQRVTRATRQGDKVELDIVSTSGARDHLVVDHVLAATGYRVDVDAMTVLDQAIRQRLERVAGFPLLDASFESSVPGLFFAGLASAGTFGPLMRFVCGTDFASPRLARAVAARR
jgi:hypothetical protein